MRKFLLWVFVFLFLVSCVCGLVTVKDDRLLGYYPLNETDGMGLVYDWKSNARGFISLTNDGCGAGSDKKIGAYGQSYAMTNNCTLKVVNETFNTYKNNYTLVAFYEQSSNTEFYVWKFTSDGSNCASCFYTRQEGNAEKLSSSDGDVGDVVTGTPQVFFTVNQSWFHTTIINSTGGYYYRNTTLVNNASGSITDAAVGFNFSFYGNVSMIAIFAGQLSPAEMKDVYDWGILDFESVDGINVSSPFPISGDQFSDVVVNVNASVNSSYDFECGLFVGDVFNQSVSLGGGADVLASFNLSFSTGQASEFEYYLSCYNNMSMENTSKKNFYVDVVNPVLAHNFVNGSVYFLNNVSGQFNFSDGLVLFSYNVSVDGVQVSGKSDLDTDFFSYNMSLNPASFVPGSHVLGVRFADGHTSKKIGDYDWGNGLFNDFLEYDFGDGSFFRTELKDKSFLDSWSTEKRVDKYVQFLEPALPKETQVLVEKSSSKISVIRKPGFYGGVWVVSGGHWKDYVLENEPESKVSVKRVSDYEVEITISGIKNSPERLVINSVGDLNVVQQNFSFVTVNYSLSYASSVYETALQTMNFSINKSVSSYANLSWDGSLKSVSKFDLGGYDFYTSSFTTPIITGLSQLVNFSWEYFLFSSVNNESGNVTFNQTVFKINIGNCSNKSWFPALTLVSKDEEDDGDLDNLTLNIDLDVWFLAENLFRNYSFGFRNSPNYSICIYPNESVYYVNSIMEYVDEGDENISYDHRKYYLDNYTLNNVSDFIYLYNIDDSKSSDVTFSVYDRTTGGSVSGAFVKFLRFYPDTGNYRTVEIERSDESGQTLAKLVLADVFYKYIVEKDRVVVLNSGVGKVLSTSELLAVNITGDVLESFKKVGDVSTSVTCTNTTSTCRFTWSDSSNIVQSAKLKVFRINAYGQNLIHEESASSVAGSMVYVIGENLSGNTYLAEGFLTTGTDDFVYVVGSAELINEFDISSWGGSSVLFPVMLLVLAICFALIDVGAVGVIVGSMIGLVVLLIVGIAPFGFTSVISLMILGGILIAKIKK